MDNLDVTFAVLACWQVTVLLDVEGATIVVEVSNVLVGIGIGFAIELLLAE